MNIQELDADAVSRYLQENPTFFLTQQSLLENLSLPHESGKATSLLEHQIGLLRERNIETRKRLDEVLGLGAANDVLFKKTRNLILELLDTQQLNELSKKLVSYCQQEFQVDAVQFTLLANDNTHKVNTCQVLTEEEVKLGMANLLTRTDAWSGVFREAELSLLFADKSEGVASAVVMPIRQSGKIFGFIALGSYDAHYFQSGMDTIFLSFIADVLAKLLPKYC